MDSLHFFFKVKGMFLQAKIIVLKYFQNSDIDNLKLHQTVLKNNVHIKI